MHNVSLLITENENIWLGNLSTEEHYQSIIEWAIETSRNDQNAEISPILRTKVFDYDGDTDDIINRLFLSHSSSQYHRRNTTLQ